MAHREEKGAGGHRRRPGRRPERAAGGPRRLPTCGGRRVRPSWSRPPCRSATSSGSRRPRRRRGCWPTAARTVSTAWCRPRWASRPGTGTRTRRVALLGDLAFLHDVSGLVNLPEFPAPSSWSTTAAEGSSRSSRRRQRSSRRLRAALRHAAHAATSARSRAGSASGRRGRRRCRARAGPGRGPHLGAGPGPGVAGAGRERRPARRDQPGGPSRAAVNAGDGVEVESRPVGLRKVSSTLASPETLHPISCTQRWCWSHSSTRLSRSVGPPSTQCRTWWTSVNSVWVQPGKRQPLSRRRISIRWASVGSRRVRPEVEAPPVRPVGRHQDLGVAGQPPCHLAETGPSTSSSAPPSPPARKPGRRGRPLWAGCAACPGPAPGTSPSRAARRPVVALADGDQGVGHPLVERACGRGRGELARASERALHDGVLILGEDARQARAADRRNGGSGGRRSRSPAGPTASARRWRAHGPAWPTSASPARPAGRPSRAWPPRPAA